MNEDRYNERADVARRILELSETIDVAIGHMVLKIGSFNDDMGVCAGMLKGIGEGLISLDNAASSITGPMGVEPGDIERLAIIFDGLCEELDIMADACLEGRAADLPSLVKAFHESFKSYSGELALCFKNSAVM